uniref:Uncharacterized protein n=1 Tax=Anguilla anguilla TaxID=7936 RepID=A0A0E9XL66_ANGAN
MFPHDNGFQGYFQLPLEEDCIKDFRTCRKPCSPSVNLFFHIVNSMFKDKSPFYASHIIFQRQARK